MRFDQFLSKPLSKDEGLTIATEVLRLYLVRRFEETATPQNGSGVRALMGNKFEPTWEEKQQEELQWQLENALIVPEWTTQTLNNWVFWWTDRYDLRLVNGVGDRNSEGDRFGNPGPIVVDKRTGKATAFHSDRAVLQTGWMILVQPVAEGSKENHFIFDCPLPNPSHELVTAGAQEFRWKRSSLDVSRPL